MKAEVIFDAFSQRKVLDREISSSEFEDMACDLARLRDCDQLKLLPVLMTYVLRHHNDERKINYAEMVVFRLMPQSPGWENLIDEMNKIEINATLEWLVSCKDFPFVTNCKEELGLAIELFNKRSGSKNDAAP